MEFRELATAWGFSAVLLANGAWRDRPLEVPGVDDYVGRGFVYQNPLIYWFNHKNERAYSGLRYEVPDGTLCVGGGLASIDVIKVIQLEIYERALRKRGLEPTMYELEHEGIAKFLEKKAIDPKSLGVTDGMLITGVASKTCRSPIAPPPPTPPMKAEGEERSLGVPPQVPPRFEEMARFAVHDPTRHPPTTVAETRVEGKESRARRGFEHDLRSPLVISVD
jgi:hypothetical protein